MNKTQITVIRIFRNSDIVFCFSSCKKKIMSRQEFIDRYLGKAISKTFTVFTIATVALFASKLSGTEWVIIATTYIGSTKVTETILKLKDKS